MESGVRKSFNVAPHVSGGSDFDVHSHFDNILIIAPLGKPRMDHGKYIVLVYCQKERYNDIMIVDLLLTGTSPFHCCCSSWQSEMLDRDTEDVRSPKTSAATEATQRDI